MKSLIIGKAQEHKLNPFLKAAVLLAAAGCNEAPMPQPVTVIEIPAQRVPAYSKPERADAARERPAESLVPTTMTMLRTGNVFLAYVSVPDGEGMRDLEDPKSSFYYSAKSSWSVISGCERAFSCDASAVISGNPSGVLIKAEFSEPGYRPCVSEPHPAGSP